MGLKKGQTNNKSGRPKGVPNKVSQGMRAWIDVLLNDSRDLMISDIGKLEPKDRLNILEKLMQYTIPKQQSVTVEAQIQAEYNAIEKLLNNVPDKAIEVITEKILMLNQLNKDSYE